jgi:hypothetical protein
LQMAIKKRAKEKDRWAIHHIIEELSKVKWRKFSPSKYNLPPILSRLHGP